MADCWVAKLEKQNEHSSFLEARTVSIIQHRYLSHGQVILKCFWK